MTTTAQQTLQTFLTTDTNYLALEKAANDEITANAAEERSNQIASLISAGYTGEATKDDWLKLFAQKGGADVFGNDNVQNSMATEMIGNIDSFLDWNNKYKNQ